MNVNFYNFAKRKNSTKQPTGDGTIVSCNLKAPCSIKSPELLISGDVFGYNYAYIADFGRYYFVNDVVSESKGLTKYILEEDVMASNKTAIGSTVARIAFASTGYDVYIPDVRIGVSSEIEVYLGMESSGIGSGKNILTVANDNDGIAYYGMTDANVGKLVTNLMSTDVGDQIRKMLSDPMQAILNCVWVPYFPTNLNSVNVRIADKLLDGSFGMPAVIGDWISPFDKVITLSTVSITIPFQYKDFRDMSPYTQMSLFLPGIGNIDLNPNDFIGGNTVNIMSAFDITTGDIIYRICNSSMELVQTVSFAGGVPVPISGTSTNMRGAIASIGGMVGAAAGLTAAIATEGAAAPAAGALIMSGASAALSANMRSTSFKGSNGSRVDFTDTMFTLNVTVHETEDPDDVNYIAMKGRPVNETHAISNHSGYVQCDNASVSISGDSWERDEINSYLNSGFFYE